METVMTTYKKNGIGGFTEVVYLLWHVREVIGHPDKASRITFAPASEIGRRIRKKGEHHLSVGRSSCRCSWWVSIHLEPTI